MNVFTKYDRIKWDGILHSCVCADEDTAVFAPVKGDTTVYSDMFAVSNNRPMYDAIASHVERVD